ncbi:MAG: TIGR00304 family membrane protein [Thermoplasmata archaeon]
MIGPIPIIFGNSEMNVKILIILTIVLMIIMTILMLLFLH